MIRILVFVVVSAIAVPAIAGPRHKCIVHPDKCNLIRCCGPEGHELGGKCAPVGVKKLCAPGPTLKHPNPATCFSGGYVVWCAVNSGGGAQ